MSGISDGVFEICGLDTVFAPGPWDFYERERARIDAHWQQAIAEKPKLFDGRVLLMREAALSETARGAVLRGKFFATDFRAFHAWMSFGPRGEGVFNAFGMAALRSADGAFLLGEMGGHTMNAGMIYFAAGTPDMSDVFGDRVDLEASIAREMAEETGFQAGEAPPSPGFALCVFGHRLAVMQRRQLGLTAAEAIARTAKFIAADPDPELARLVAVFGEEQIDSAKMLDFIQAFLRAQFSARPAQVIA